MNTRYIRKNRNSYKIVKDSKSYGKFTTIDDAIFFRDELADNGWNLDSIEEICWTGNEFIIACVIDEKIHILLKSETVPEQSEIKRMIKEKKRNPNNSRYGLNIMRIFDTFIIKKQIAGDEYIFGYYDNLSDAQFVRNHLIDNMWNTHSFSQIEYDEDSDDYKITEVIDDKVYVLASFKSRDDIDITQVHREFLSKITKHKLGLAHHPYLDELKDKIPELEEKFNTKAHDDMLDFKNTNDPLNDIIFNLTPFQKSVYDAVDDSTVEEIEKSLIRFKSKNFTQKIQKNLDELENKGLVIKNQNHYIKRNP